MPWIDDVEIARGTPATKTERGASSGVSPAQSKPELNADEKFPAAAVQLLRDTSTHGSRSQANGHRDENHAGFALKNGCVLLTCDRDYLDEQRFPLIHCPAIVVFDFGSGSLLEVRQTFKCLRSMYSGPQFLDKWVNMSEIAGANTAGFDDTTSRARYRVHRGRLQEWVQA